MTGYKRNEMMYDDGVNLKFVKPYNFTANKIE